jgi:uncharacterized protein YutE (UPF0331/DUF86 family)
MSSTQTETDMNPKYYPALNEDQILLINRVFRSLEEDPNYLNSQQCNYSPVIKAFFTRVPTTPGVTTDLFEGDEVVAVERQIQKLINDLEDFAGKLTDADSSEKLQYFKTKTALLEKLIGHLERAANLKQINEFRGLVIQFMDEILDKDQITNFMQRIDGVLKNGK